jgi:acyl-protein synthetase LuxE
MFPDGRRMRILAIHPTADRMPESSLSQMISWCIEEFGAGRCECVADRQRVDTNAAYEFLAHTARADEMVCILATTASLGALFAHLEDNRLRVQLAAGSRIMDTGGAKGQASPLDAEAVCARAQELLGIAPMLVINEYGMTELCSQLYDATAFNSDDDSAPSDRIKIAPPWMHAAALNPVSLRPVAPGEIGMLRFFDLANVGSVSAILTEDFGIVHKAGNRIRIIGRAGVAEPRGCALAIEQFEAAEIQRLQ